MNKHKHVTVHTGENSNLWDECPKELIVPDSLNKHLWGYGLSPEFILKCFFKLPSVSLNAYCNRNL